MAYTHKIKERTRVCTTCPSFIYEDESGYGFCNNFKTKSHKYSTCLNHEQKCFTEKNKEYNN